MRAFRYDDAGKLIPCDFCGVEMRFALPQPLRWRFSEWRRRVGVFAADFEREARLPGGPPTWFAVNLSRRKRWAAWARTSRQERAERAAAARPYEDTKVVRLRGHHFGREMRSGPPWNRTVHQEEAVLYLPEGEEPTEAHVRELDRAMRETAR